MYWDRELGSSLSYDSAGKGNPKCSGKGSSKCGGKGSPKVTGKGGPKAGKGKGGPKTKSVKKKSPKSPKSSKSKLSKSKGKGSKSKCVRSCLPAKMSWGECLTVLTLFRHEQRERKGRTLSRVRTNTHFFSIDDVR